MPNLIYRARYNLTNDHGLNSNQISALLDRLNVTFADCGFFAYSLGFIYVLPARNRLPAVKSAILLAYIQGYKAGCNIR